MAFFRLNETFTNGGTDWAELYSYTNTAKRNLFVNRWDLILPPLSAKYIAYRIRHNGIIIYERDERETTPFTQFPIRNLIKSIPRDDTISIETRSLNPRQSELDVTISMDLDFASEPYPAALTPLTNADLIGITETVPVFDGAHFTQAFSESHYSTLNIEGYSKMLLLITANEEYNPHIISNELLPLPADFFSIFTGSYRSNSTALTRTGTLGPSQSYTQWDYADGTTFQFITSHVAGTTEESGEVERNNLFLCDLNEAGRRVVFPRVFNGSVRLLYYNLPAPFTLYPDGQTPPSTNKNGFDYEGTVQQSSMRLIDDSTMYLIVRQTLNNIVTWRLWQINPNLGNAEDAELTADIDITAILTDIKVGNDPNPTINFVWGMNISKNGRTMAISYASATSDRKMHTVTITTANPYDFSSPTVGQRGEYTNASADIEWGGTDTGGEYGYIVFDTAMGRRLYNTERLADRYIVPDGTPLAQNFIEVPDLFKLTFRFDDGQIYISYKDSGTLTLKARTFQIRAPGWTLLDAQGMPFLPFSYRGRYDSQRIEIDANNPDGESRTYRLEIEDAGTPVFDYEYLYAKSIYNSYGRSSITLGRGRGHSASGRINMRRNGVRIFSENVQVIEIYGYNEGETPALLRTLTDFAGTQTLEITTTKRYIRVLKRIAFSFDWENVSRITAEYEDRYRGASSTSAAQLVSRFAAFAEFVNALPENGIPSERGTVGYADSLQWPEQLQDFSFYLRNQTDSAPVRSSLQIPVLARLPLPVSAIIISIEALKADGTYQEIIPNIGQIATLGETAITISEAFEGRVLPKGQDAIRFKVTVDGKTTLSMDAVLSN